MGEVGVRKGSEFRSKLIITQDNHGKETFLYMQAVAKFIEVIETLMITKDNPIVGDLRTPL